MVTQRITEIWIGWVLFIICLVLPASVRDNNAYEYGWEFAAITYAILFDLDFYRGWKYFYFAAPSIGNTLIVFSPLIVRVKSAPLLLSFAIIFILYGILAASYVFYRGPELSGTFIYAYYLWVASFFTVGVGYTIKYNGVRHSYRRDWNRI